MTTASGRPAATRSPLRRRAAARVLVSVAVVGLGGAFLADEGASPAPAESWPVSAALLACPDLTTTPSGARDPVLAGPLDLAVRTAGTAGGRVRVATRAAELRTRFGGAALTQPPSAARGGRGSVLVSAQGASAAGLSAIVTGVGDGAGPARARCLPPRVRSWFAGPSTTAGRDPIVILSNLADQPAQVGVRVFTDGTASPPQDISVPPGQAVTRRLAALAPEAAVTALDVEVRSGRVLAWMVDRSSLGGPFTAPRLVPVTAPPARRLLLGGVLVPAGPPGPAARLVLAAPDREATVCVSVLTAAGRHTPVGLEAVRVPATGAITLPVPLPPGGASAVLVESTAGAAAVVAELGVASGWPGVSTWAGAVRLGASSGRRGLDAFGQGVGLSDPTGPTAGAGTAPDAAVDVPAPPVGAAGAVVLAAPAGPVTAWLDGDPVRLGAGTVALVRGPSGPAGGRLVAIGGPLVATAVVGAAQAPDPSGLGTAQPPVPPAVPPWDTPPTGPPVARPAASPLVLPKILSAVVPLGGAPRLLDALPAVADPAVPYR
ncbi:hypothetical protein FF36_01960 [Frankia torreyi]|uniref:Secreted protein n=1 Tax=Frankia torreyi TaxID=1856 RepID=A0A0D8BI94_9ACTN|nr:MULTISPECIES: DUF5719 family protein [Frankia]KJE23775.1 hypothetical protein FF36_01960 [Frankia torreyi]KQC38949.1 hypothetical protein UK82_07010 [Frankia sp. ACN1ag]KQM05613.1 hypothetical protein FF86_101431 [Frankia sp. CpI1-P]